MTSLEFITKLNSVNEKSKILENVYIFINNFSGEYSKEEICDFIEDLSEDNFTSFGNKLGLCRVHCLEELKKTDNESEAEYLQKLRTVEKTLSELSTIYQNVAAKIKEERNAKEAEALSKNVTDAIKQNLAVIDEARTKIEDFRKDLKTAKEDIEKANNQIEDSQNTIDEKIFSLLINTVAILGIFVAIAFAGLGITSLFSDLDFATAFASKENFIRTVFFLFLVALLSYNLLLLLIYFIYKLSRPIFMGTVETTDNGNSQRFKDSIELKPFYVVDGILFAVIIALFAWGICTFSSDNNASDNVTLDEESYVNSETTSGEIDMDSEIIVGEET